MPDDIAPLEVTPDESANEESTNEESTPERLEERIAGLENRIRELETALAECVRRGELGTPTEPQDNEPEPVHFWFKKLG